MAMKKNNNPKNKFKMLLAILTAIALLIIVLFLAAFGMLQLAQEYGLVGTPGEKITLENLSDIDIGGSGYKDDSVYHSDLCPDHWMLYALPLQLC